MRSDGDPTGGRARVEHRAGAKRRLDDLALFGGTPAFDEPLHVGRPNIGDRAALHRRLDGILDRRWLTNDGPLVREFEARLAGITGVRNVVAVTNATTGLEVLFRAMRLSGEVILPSLTFVATAHALTWMGLRPVFCDIDPDSLTLDPAMVESLIGPETSAILGVHLWGRVCQTEQLDAIAREAGIPVVYDAAHAFGCSQGGHAVGGFGSAEVLSFHATKVVNAFEGGAICTDDDRIANDARQLINFGFEGLDRSTAVGTNGKMHEMSAAMGLTSLEAAERIIAENRAHFVHYAEGLQGIAGIQLLDDVPAAESNGHYVVTRLASGASLTRDQIQHVLTAEGVLARRYFYPGCHRLPPYSDDRRTPLPVTEALADHVLVLPTGTAIDESAVRTVCDLVRFAMDNGHAIGPRIGST